MREKAKESFWAKHGPAIVAGLVIFGGWEFVTRVFQVSELVLPPFTKVLYSLVVRFPNDLAPQFWLSLRVAAAGVAVAAILGVSLAAMLSQSKVMIQLTTPLVIFLMTMPMIALAPVLVILLGAGFGFRVRFFVVVLQATPVIMLNTMHGFQKTTKSNLELANLYGMNRWQIISKIQFPSALPEIFSGIRLGCIFSTMATIGVELIIGNAGLGYWIPYCLDYLLTSTAMACVVLIYVIGKGLQLVVDCIEKLTYK